MVAGLQAGESVFRHWCAEIVADRFGKGEKIFGHHRTHRMNADVISTRFTTAGAIETCHWRGATRVKYIAVHVGLIADGHVRSQSLDVDANESANDVGGARGEEQNPHLSGGCHEHWSLGESSNYGTNDG